MSKYWSNKVKDLEPYIPGEQPRDKSYIKLNTNENPYPPSPRVVEAIRETAARGTLRLYPDPACHHLRTTIAGYYGLSSDEVFAGNGSDELLAFAFLAFFNPGQPILFPDITYSFYPVYSELFNIDYRLIPLDEEFAIPVEMFHQDNGGIIFPNPNAPTGRHLDLASIESILQHNTERIVIVDEAYVDFGGESAVGLIPQYPNLLIIGTLSKSRSLAGLRVGFALGNKALIEGLDKVKNSFNSYTLDGLALAGAIEAFKDDAYFQETKAKVIQTREDISKKLQALGFVVIPSTANFIFISHSRFSAVTIQKQLREKGVLVRYFPKPRIDNYLRVSIGSPEEMERFLEIVKEIVS